MRATCVAWTFLLVIAHSAPAAQAQEAPAAAGAPAQSSAEADRLAADHYLAGIRALEAGRDVEAHAELLRAWELKRHWQIAANLGEVELRLGRYGEAVEHLEHFLREAEGVREDEIRRAEEMLREARRQAEAERRAREAAQKSASASAPASAPAAATVSNAQVSEGAGQGGAVRGGAGEEAPGSRPLWWPAIGAAGVAFVGIGVGVGFTIAANAKASEAEGLLGKLRREASRDQDVCPDNPAAGSDCAALADRVNEKYRLTNAAIVGYAVGGVAAVGAAVLAIWPIRVGEGGRYIGVAPAPGPGGGALFLKGAF